MNFKEAYQKEINHLHCSEEFMKKSLEEALKISLEYKGYKNKQESKSFYKKKSWRIGIAAIALVCILTCTINRSKIAGFANSIFGSFSLQTEEELMVFGDIETINFDKKSFVNDSGTELIGGKQYYQCFEDYKAMNHIIEFKLPGADKLEYKNISLSIHMLGEGHLSARVIYKGYEFGINGMFATGNYHPEELGYGEERKAEEVYLYAEGKKAYFIRLDKEENDREERGVVYFLEENILFQMYFNVKEIDIIKEMLVILSED